MLSASDQTALGLIGIYIAERNFLDCILIGDGSTRSKPSLEQGGSAEKAISDVYNSLFWLTKWYQGEDISVVMVYGEPFSGNPSLRENGILTVVRKLFDAQFALQEKSSKTSDMDIVYTYVQEFQAIARKCILLMDLWELGEDIAYHRLTMS